MILKYFRKRDWALTAALVVFIICQVYLDLEIPGYMNDITYAIQTGSGTDVVKEYGTDMVLCAFLSLGFSVAAGFCATNIAASLGRTLRERQFDRVQEFSMQDMDRFSAASLITRSTNDVYHLMVFTARGLQIVIKSPILATWALLKISGKNWEWTAATAAAVVVLVAVVAVTMWYTVPRFKKIQWLTDGINRATRENLDGIRVIRAYNAEEYQQKKFDKANDDLLENNVANAHAMAPMHPITSSLNNFLTLAIYWIGAGLIAAAGSTGDKMVLFSDMIVFSSYAMQVVSAFMLMIGIIRGLPRAMVAAGRVEEVIEAEPSIKDGGFDGVTDAEGEVEFRDVGFSYPDAEGPAIEKVSFKVGKGQTLAIIGPTGSGKSTLVNLIPRFYDATGGQVLVDGIDVREYDQKALRRRIGYVPQSAVIFSGSVEYNVNYGDTSADRTEDDVRKALEIAQGIDFVEKMEGGMDGHVSQYGRNVSGGQKQRICIARAVCKRPEILIFDDTFSALDFKTDLALRESLKRETAGTTNIIVAQRIGTIMDADRIIVLDKGKVVGDGTHDRLMKECGIYRNIAMSQMTGEGPE
ncbi:Lipid A export ATP-binding/permease protein MsbA [Candidatus Methanomethylophilus alvi Mx1201]|uniref:Lipid A export ATP-binding/permease protein MsbA n=1 Tax=Methanomethylophilus alvi (strain Mx1201) TaxID=1236689 RepID=M9SCL8_METAX|nr:ABC transporter ATP-binding protein [Methanomethylophilus alvi]AGI85504.1 Lipid A export ATP-binding/permease protein MsbA [Candidatus Methanomethylophilus alvi Mx1201]